MTGQLDTRIDAALRSMMTWEDAPARTWEKALANGPARASGGAAPVPFWEREIKSSWRPIAAALLVCMMTVLIALPSLSKARRASPTLIAEAERRASEYAERESGMLWAGQGYKSVPQFDLNSALQNSGGERGPFAEQPEPTPRLVERRATLELEVADARAAYVKARALVSEARGEFVQGGRISEQGEQHRADLVLRVQASRLDEVLDALRSLGTVKDERLDAADVTEQTVDLEARLANERRIETELLGLLDKRPDDKLEDILRVRAELAGVRERIERLVAQRSNLGSLVALSTVTVLIAEPADKPVAETEEEGLWTTFKHDLGDAWRSGVEALLRFVVWMVEIAIAGLPLWLITAAAVVLAWRSYRRHHPRPLPV